MDVNEYQKAALRTVNHSIVDKTDALTEGLMGLSGEAGECIDLLKKHMFQGHMFDRERFAEELGDVAWYLAISANAIGYDLETVLQMNIDKLWKRYPNGFDAEHSINRGDADKSDAKEPHSYYDLLT